ncbi:MAG TPA: ZIP family metal transporter [Coprothermobacter proteolyticus]|nr:ZIP family metal transporter [Coprothermobacter proteolyticus]
MGILIPFIGTSAGALSVLLMKKDPKPSIQNFLLGFSAGVMIAASVWSLLLPSIEMSEQFGRFAWLPAAVGFLFGIFFLLFLDNVIPHLHLDQQFPEGPRSNLQRVTMLVLAVTLHNIPEGMAVGVLFASALQGSIQTTFAAAYVLSLGIALQNIPEGAIISLPLRAEGLPLSKSVIYGILSGIVEPVAALVTLLLTNVVVSILPYLLAFAAGAMIYVVVEELIPESQTGPHSNVSTIGVAIGFVIMMILDVALG